MNLSTRIIRDGTKRSLVPATVQKKSINANGDQVDAPHS